ncbi:MAG: hypothetical protein R3C39_05310 [Dehalococcoidia bacterium]
MTTLTRATQRELLADAKVAQDEVALPEFGLVQQRVHRDTLTQADTDQILELLRVAYNGGPAWYTLPVPPEDHWRWRYYDRPGPAGAALLRRVDDGRIVGLNMRAYLYWLVQGVPRRGNNGGDLAAHPDIQGTGVQRASSDWRDAHREPDEQPEFALGLGAHPTSIHRAERRGAWMAGNQPETWEYILDARAALVDRRLPDEGELSGSKTTAAIYAGGKRIPRPWLARYAKLQARRLLARARSPLYRPMRDLSWTIRTVETFPADIDTMLEEALAQFELVLLREHDYLNWRYCDHRAGPFTVRIAEEGDRIVGYAVTRAMADRGELVDLLALPGRTDVARSLVEDSIRLARAAGAPTLRTWMMQHHPYQSIFPMIGFLRGDQWAHIRVRPERQRFDMSFLRSPTAAVHLMLGDTDTV